MRYQINNGVLNELSDVPINPSSNEINNFDNRVIWYEDNNGFLYNYLKINNTNILLNKIQLPYLKFSSDSSFTLSVSNPVSELGWNGTIEYLLGEGNTWNTWNGSQLLGDENNPVYLRGIGNTKIGGSYSKRWLFTGKYIIGNIETLLDYQTVVNGQHPTMDDFCYNQMFKDCTSLITTPKLPATTLVDSCYFAMFLDCTSLKLSTTQDSDVYKYPYRIPTSGTGTGVNTALTYMFTNTGGTFKNKPTINTTYYTDHQPV